jgi:hypothetical protein
LRARSGSACNHDPDMSPSKPVRPQIVNEPHIETTTQAHVIPSAEEREESGGRRTPAQIPRRLRGSE